MTMPGSGLLGRQAVVGPDLGRVVQVRVVGGTRGTGFLVAEDLVLTAAHVVKREPEPVAGSGSDSGSGSDGEVAVQVRLFDPGEPSQVPWVSATVVPAGADAERLDVALLRIEAGQVREPGTATPAWGQIGTTAQVPVFAVCFPRMMKDHDGPDSHVIRGVVESGQGGIKFAAGKATLTITDGSIVPARGAAGDSPWAGASGAAVFAARTGHLIGVLTDDFDVARDRNVLMFALVAQMASLAEFTGTAVEPLVPELPPNAVLAQALDEATEDQLRMLARLSKKQWTDAANDRRLKHPVPLPIRWRRATARAAGPISAAEYRRFDPLPGLAAVTNDKLREGDQAALHAIYGGLPSGRLLLLGKPGSGKSAAAILLLLDALQYRENAKPEEQAQIPVPVLFTLHGWNPDRGDSVTDGMVDKLAETYSMFRTRAGRSTARQLLEAGRIAVFLDGLDEIPEPMRPRVVTALADASFRLVLATRTDEAVAAADHGPLAGAVAVELEPVAPADAAKYLLQTLADDPPDPWKALTSHLAAQAENGSRRSRSIVARALATPLAVSLLRDVYDQASPVDELLDEKRFPDTAAIENHLLDEAVAVAYAHRPGRPVPRYSAATAHRTLRYLAVQLTEQQSSELAWWHIPTWTTHRSRMIRIMIATVLGSEFMWGLGLTLSVGPGLALLAGLIFGLANCAGLLGGHLRGIPLVPKQITRPTYRNTRQSLGFALATGLSSAFLTGLPAGLVSGPSVGLVLGLSVGLVSGLAGVAFLGFTRHLEVDSSSLEPAGMWRRDRNGLMNAPLVGLMIGLAATLTFKIDPAFASRLTILIPVVLLVAIFVAFASSAMVKRVGPATGAPGAASVDTAMALVHLAIRHKIPLRLIAFLEDARSKHLLRTVGPVYQFRHASLQARLAQAAPVDVGGTASPRPE